MATKSYEEHKRREKALKRNAERRTGSGEMRAKAMPESSGKKETGSSKHGCLEGLLDLRDGFCFSR